MRISARTPRINPAHRWFSEARFGLFIHWGIYSLIGRGEQVLFREHLDQREYAKLARRFNPTRFDADAWAKCAKDAGMRYAVLTTKHHDGFCLFDSALTDYTAARTAAGRDLVAEYIRAFRRHGLRVGLYYSLADWRFPAYFNGPEADPEAFAAFRDYIHGQVRELCTNYGKIDVMWFDGVWPHSAETWHSQKLIRMIRRLQPGILINNRLGGGAGAGQGGLLGDFGTPEHHITPDPNRMWESCQVSTWRLWGYTRGERWRPADLLIDMLCDAASKGGNLLLNVGPRPDGTFPAPFLKRAAEIGRWMKKHGEAIYGSGPEVCEFITHGRQTVKGNTLYLLIRFWPGPEVHLAGLRTKVLRAKLLTTGARVRVDQRGEHLYLCGLPKRTPDPHCAVIALTCEGRPEAYDWARHRLWQGDPRRMASWAAG
ncbi:MAG: alpha-L-fucosidase [Candidatus Handelsmanbacteria bacterium RIFCSPLOWO2_12_FULL_64_10]|uniref:alpha-L-fucosidase n=1 Tax=Handelsmanbacteria sp. (strain RIFCSPLOWO2_12_FULL_64_10) TaxID=1817868 RepID=A0A1F6CVQ2_HANXR|nr:MAG: alpha-L-fucosidase [Candidatus Handelsmanbacteria bacterium RIFCSPLOWO2_12_FULL_64_10]